MSLHRRPAVTTDTVLCAREGMGSGPHVLLVQRGNDPFKGKWGLPGGFLEIDEELEEGARRELQEETGIDLTGEAITQMGTFGKIGRDPRGRTVSVVYFAFVEADRLNPRAGSDAAAVEWYPLAHLPELAFDHADILRWFREHHLG